MSTYLVWIPDRFVKGTVFGRKFRDKLVPGLHGGGATGDSCCWMFRYKGGYRPASGLQKDRVLMTIEFVWQVDKYWLTDVTKHINFESAAFKGESKHPGKIIVKNNEPGAFGVGQGFLEKFSRHISSMDVASAKEFAWAVDQSVVSSKDIYKEMADRYKRLL